MISRNVQEYSLVGQLGEGSFAMVFLAKHRETGREVAMKAISRSRLQGKLQDNLESEISILKSFRHANIVELYDIKKTERHIYLVLEYCAGGDLRALIRREGKLEESVARHFMRHLGEIRQRDQIDGAGGPGLGLQGLGLWGPGLGQGEAGPRRRCWAEVETDTPEPWLMEQRALCCLLKGKKNRLKEGRYIYIYIYLKHLSEHFQGRVFFLMYTYIFWKEVGSRK
ncbi:unnamed protein product [Discosporangium mesarthrocarpum]